MQVRARLSFPQGEHADVVLAPGTCCIGSTTANRVALAVEGVRPQHARIDLDGRGLTLTVLDPTAQVHVNARPVREKAILHLGDRLCIDTVVILIKPESDTAIHTVIPEESDGEAETRLRNLPPRALLRGVSGSHFGRIVSLHARLLIGRGSDCDLVLDEPEMSRRHAMIENSGDGLYLRDLGSANGTFVNGVQVRDAVLHPGDQIAFDRNRFLLEAPGLPLRGEDPARRSGARGPVITQTLRAVDEEDLLEPPRPARHEVWWLIGAAALIGLGIALLLVVRF